MTNDPNRTDGACAAGTAHDRACDEGVAFVQQRAAEDAERLRTAREAFAADMAKRISAYEDAKQADPPASPDDGTLKAPPVPETPRPPRPRRRRGRFLRTLRIAIACILILAAVFIIGRYWPRIEPLIKRVKTTEISSTAPASIEALLPDETMGYNSIDFQNAVLGQTRSVTELVVMEQDVQVDSQISQALINIALFSKTKTVHSVGTGLYTVDLSEIKSDAVAVDLEKKSITVTIPHAKLTYINIDPEKMTFEDTERAFFAFGDIELTAEQQNILETSVQDAMREHLNDQKLFDAADENARQKVGELLLKPVATVSGDFTVSVVQP